MLDHDQQWRVRPPSTSPRHAAGRDTVAARDVRTSRNNERVENGDAKPTRRCSARTLFCSVDSAPRRFDSLAQPLTVRATHRWRFVLLREDGQVRGSHCCAHSTTPPCRCRRVGAGAVRRGGRAHVLWPCSPLPFVLLTTMHQRSARSKAGTRAGLALVPNSQTMHTLALDKRCGSVHSP